MSHTVFVSSSVVIQSIVVTVLQDLTDHHLVSEAGYTHVQLGKEKGTTWGSHSAADHRLVLSFQRLFHGPILGAAVVWWPMLWSGCRIEPRLHQERHTAWNDHYNVTTRCDNSCTKEKPEEKQPPGSYLRWGKTCGLRMTLTKGCAIRVPQTDDLKSYPIDPHTTMPGVELMCLYSIAKIGSLPSELSLAHMMW